MTRHTAHPLKNLRLSPTYEPVTQLVRQAERGVIILDPPYQRGNVWDIGQRIALIRSLMTGTPIPAIITNARSARSRAVIDGKQRITTLAMWLNNEFMVPFSWFTAEEVARITCILDEDATPELVAEYGDTGAYVKFSNLTEDGWYFTESPYWVSMRRVPLFTRETADDARAMLWESNISKEDYS